MIKYFSVSETFTYGIDNDLYHHSYSRDIDDDRSESWLETEKMYNYSSGKILVTILLDICVVWKFWKLSDGYASNHTASGSTYKVM